MTNQDMFRPADWITPAAAVSEYGLPLELIHGAMMRGDMTVRGIAGETLVRRPEVRALRLRLMANRGCNGCDE